MIHLNKLNILFFASLMLLAVACEQHEVGLYSGPDQVHFMTTSGSLIVDETNPSFTIEIGTSRVADKERNYTILLVEDGSSATEGLDFEFVTNTVTIPAGETIGSFEVRGLFEGVTIDGTMAQLSIQPAQGELATYDDAYELGLYKFCTYEQAAFIGDYTVYEASYWGNFEYPVSNTAGGNSFEVNSDGIWEVYGNPIAITFDTRTNTCSIADQFLFSDASYGVVHIRSFENGTYNSCTGEISGLSYYIFEKGGQNRLFDIATARFVKNAVPAVQAQSTEDTERRDLRVIEDNMNY
jgi:hypothetical protein